MVGDRGRIAVAVEQALVERAFVEQALSAAGMSWR